MIDPLARYDLGDAPEIGGARAVLETPDLARVRALPERREISDHQVRALSAALNSQGRLLRPHQAAALRELYEVGGLVAPLPVGAGKTLITLLAPTLLDAQRPVLVTRKRLLDEARMEYLGAREAGWDVRLPKLLSYEEIAHPNGELKLELACPDLLIFDEAHKLKNLKSASSVRRVARAIQLHRPRVAMLSGSMFSKKLLDYWHMLCWSLGPSAPVPLNYQEAKLWDQALCPGDGWETVSRGALVSLGDFYEHMHTRRGIVSTVEENCDAQIVLHRWEPEIPPRLAEVIREVAQTKTRPDGELLEDKELADCLVQLSQGFWYRWHPAPPDCWREARKQYRRYQRAVVEAHLDGFDSTFAVENALRLGSPRAPDHEYGAALRTEWLRVEPLYDPKKHRAVEWIDDAPLRAAIDCPSGTLIWTRHTAALQRLGELGVPAFGGGGADPRVRHAGRTCAVSISAHGTGKNLQAWSRNRILTIPASPSPLEQLMGRTHRAGQTATEVSFDLYTATEYATKTLSNVINESDETAEAARMKLKINKGTWR